MKIFCLIFKIDEFILQIFHFIVELRIDLDELFVVGCEVLLFLFNGQLFSDVGGKGGFQLFDFGVEGGIFLEEGFFEGEISFSILLKFHFITFDFFLHDIEEIMSYFLIDFNLIQVINFFHEVLMPQMQVIIGIGQLTTSILKVIDGHDQHYFPAVAD